MNLALIIFVKLVCLIGPDTKKLLYINNIYMMHRILRDTPPPHPPKAGVWV